MSPVRVSTGGVHYRLSLKGLVWYRSVWKVRYGGSNDTVVQGGPWYGMVWQGSVGYGMVWYDLVGYGTAV